MDIDLNDLSLRELKDLQARVGRAIASYEDRKKKEALTELEEKAREMGYSLAERKQRLPEAKQLIEQALSRAPDDAYIQDSLGWVEFRMGNIEAALRILQGAFQKRPDAEIAAHLGEVLWVAGQREQALAVWREGLLLNNENETLLETLQRLQAKP